MDRPEDVGLPMVQGRPRGYVRVLYISLRKLEPVGSRG